MTEISNLSAGLGVKTNKAKNHDFSEEQRYTGFIWNGKHHTVRLPEEKLEERKAVEETS